MIIQQTDSKKLPGQRRFPFWLILLLGIILLFGISALIEKDNRPSVDKEDLQLDTKSLVEANSTTFQPDILKIRVKDQTKNKLVPVSYTHLTLPTILLV